MGLSSFKFWSISHICRQSNNAAHLMARTASSSNEYHIWVEDTPPVIANQLRLDVICEDFLSQLMRMLWSFHHQKKKKRKEKGLYYNNIQTVLQENLEHIVSQRYLVRYLQISDMGNNSCSKCRKQSLFFELNSKFSYALMILPYFKCL